MGTLFGTDGIRGLANTYPITCEIALKTGQAIGEFIKKDGHTTIIIGKDTRISGDMLASALAAGAASTGVDVLLAGVIPTPGVAYLCTAIDNIGAGIVISASHNPFQDNGIKIFKQGGTKLSHEQEAQIEADILGPEIVPQEKIGKISIISDSLRKYAQFLLNKFPFKKLDEKLKLIVDCSNGAASEIAGLVFNNALFDTQFIHQSPDGKNINMNCGSQHTKELQSIVLRERADIGLAFDGDADRLIAIDSKGNQISGDVIIAICAKYAKTCNRLDSNVVVSTIMSNIGLSRALATIDVTHVKSDVGDRNVIQLMNETGAVIGGEDSGHIIFLDAHTTGDGMLCALKLIEVMIQTGRSLSDLSSFMTTYPQTLMNVVVDATRPDFMKNKSIADTINTVKQALGDKGRVLIRYSGTQPLIRVMVEGPDQGAIETYCKTICQSIQKNL